MLPDGFSTLVELSLENWTWDKLPRSRGEIWDALLHQVFLGAMVKSSQAGYVKRVLEKYLSLAVAHKVRDMNWTAKPLNTIQREKNHIIGTPGEGYKSRILGLVEQDIADGRVSQTIHDALTFFDSHNISVKKIKELENNKKATDNLVVDACNTIHNVSYVKSVLWMYGCGIARQAVPPNSHIKKFLGQYGFLSSAWTEGDDFADWEIYSICNQKMQQVASLVSDDLGKEISPKQAQSSVWYLQSCRGLISNRYSGKLTPRKMVDFLEYQGWTIDNLNHKIGDVEELDDLSESITSFLRIS
jgi:hypothetical protein